MSLLMVAVYSNEAHQPQITVETGALKRVAAYFQRSLRSSDVVARYSEGRFAVILPQTTARMAELVGGRLVAAAATAANETHHGTVRSIAVQGGISSFPKLAFDEERLVTQACAALAAVPKADSTQRVMVWEHPTDDLLAARAMGIPQLSAPREVLTARIARLLPLDLALRHHCVPAGHTHGNLVVAMLDPTDEDLLKKISAATHLKVHPVISTRPELSEALVRMAELCGTQAVLDVATQQTAQSEAEVRIVIRPLTGSVDAGRIRRELIDSCRRASYQARREDDFTVVVNTSRDNVPALLSILRENRGLLVQDIRGEGRYE
jgi:hypothetical protein